MQLRPTLVGRFLFGRLLFASTFTLCAGLSLMSAPAAAQTLLETWVFVHSRALIPLDQLKEAADGTLVAPDHPGIAKDGTEVWSVLDQSNCIIRLENTSSGTAAEFYLNNMSATRATVFKSDGNFLIGLMGDKPIQCRHRQSEKLCDRFMTLTSVDTGGYRAMERALNHIYAKFCRHGARQPDLKSPGTANPKSVRLSSP